MPPPPINITRPVTISYSINPVNGIVGAGRGTARPLTVPGTLMTTARPGRVRTTSVPARTTSIFTGSTVTSSRQRSIVNTIPGVTTTSGNIAPRTRVGNTLTEPSEIVGSPTPNSPAKPKENFQDKIRAIQRNADLSSKEKQQQIRDVMAQQNKSKASTNQTATTTKAKPCTHYKRACDMQCPTCEKYYPCRICHDEQEDHQMDRFKVSQIRCRICKLEQPCSQKCSRCQAMFGLYYCPTCHLWDNNTTSPIFHCDKCGICRRGRKQDYQHCDKCNHCFTHEFFKTHRCREDCTKTNYPICGHDLHGSRETFTVLRCGHAIHTKCFNKLVKHSYRCPLCKKCISENMSEHWKQLDMLAGLEEIPHDFRNKNILIYCNDCEQRSEVNFSFEYRKCGHCGGYNTSELEVYEAS